MNETPLAALLIDLDDTLAAHADWVDSGLRAAALSLAARAGLEAEDAFARMRYEVRDQGMTGAFARVSAYFRVAPAPLAAMETAFSDHAPALRMFPGAAEALEHLRARYRLAVVTTGDPAIQQTIGAVLRLTSRVDTVVYGGEDAVDRPAPDAFALAARRLDVAPGSCLVIGDDPYLDADAAEAFGAPFCRVLTGRFADVERPGAAPALRLASIADLPGALERGV